MGRVSGVWQTWLNPPIPRVRGFTSLSRRRISWDLFRNFWESSESSPSLWDGNADEALPRGGGWDDVHPVLRKVPWGPWPLSPRKNVLHCWTRNSYKTKRFAILHRQPLENEKFWELWTQSGPEHMTERKVFEYLHGKPSQYKCICSFLISSHFLSFSFLLFGPDWGGTSLAEDIESNFHQTMNPTSNKCLHLSSLRVRSSVFPLINGFSLLSSLYVQQQKQIRHPKQAQTREKKNEVIQIYDTLLAKNIFNPRNSTPGVWKPNCLWRVSGETWQIVKCLNVRTAHHNMTGGFLFHFQSCVHFSSTFFFLFGLGFGIQNRQSTTTKKANIKNVFEQFFTCFYFSTFSILPFFLFLRAPQLSTSFHFAFVSIFVFFHFSFRPFLVFFHFNFVCLAPCQRGDPALRAPKIDFPLKSSPTSNKTCSLCSRFRSRVFPVWCFSLFHVWFFVILASFGMCIFCSCFLPCCLARFGRLVKNRWS